VLSILMKFEMMYSLYFFLLMFIFPSSIILTSTNVLLLTLIALIWIVRARATNQKLFVRTNVDLLNVLFLMAFFLSLFNVESTFALTSGIKLIWRQVTAFCLFYLIVRFVDDEKKLERMTQLFAISGALAALTGIIELFAPGFVLIPGWIEFPKRAGMGMLGYRLQGIRVGGAIGAHNILSDYCSFSLLFMIVSFLRAKNPIGKTFWLGTAIMAFAVLLATANRGALVSFMFGFLYAMWVFRRYLNLVKYVILITTAVAAFGATQLVLDRYTIAASVTHRLVGTEFHGVVPDTRTGIWSATIEASLDHIFIGHGPLFQPGRGLKRIFWPHNGYLFYLYTLGLFGLSMFLAIAYRLFRSSLRYYHPLASGTYLGLAMAVLNVVLAMFLVGQMRTDHQRDTDFVYIYVVWILFGLIAAAGNMLDRRIREAARPADAGRQLP
ncbi:MAG: O-antigen ligase family protein, partial [bacterium]